MLTWLLGFAARPGSRPVRLRGRRRALEPRTEHRVHRMLPPTSVAGASSQLDLSFSSSRSSHSLRPTLQASSLPPTSTPPFVLLDLLKFDIIEPLMFRRRRSATTSRATGSASASSCASRPRTPTEPHPVSGSTVSFPRIAHHILIPTPIADLPLTPPIVYPQLVRL